MAPLPLVTLAVIAVSAVLVAVVGVVSSWEVLQRKPLATLRAEYRGRRSRSGGDRRRPRKVL